MVEFSNEDDVMTATVHLAFLNNVAQGAKSPEIPVATGFMSKRTMQETVKTTHSVTAQLGYMYSF